MTHTPSNHVRIVEVGPRDGLQNEAKHIPTATKVELINRLTACGFQTIEATAFVHPKWVPQMADATEVYSGIDKHADISYPVLVPNEKGMQRAIDVGVQEVAVFGAASEAFSQKNINASIAESIERFRPVLRMAAEHNIRVRGYVSTVLGCPYQGDVPLADVCTVATALHELGCYEISLGDTIGAGTPKQAQAMLKAVAEHIPMSALAVHFHDTRGQALANVLACLDEGVRVVDSSISGAGGCPYAEGASGNLATEDLLFMLHGNGFSTGVDLPQAIETGRWLSEQLGRINGAKVGLAGL